MVVVATTKVHIFKQITTENNQKLQNDALLLLPQRYIFSSKSQRLLAIVSRASSCCCYHKGTYFQANHNSSETIQNTTRVVVATTKVHIFKQITTLTANSPFELTLLLLPQRYIFSSKSQQKRVNSGNANVVVATTKVHIFKQITTNSSDVNFLSRLLLLPQRYIFSSKSQR